MAVGVVGHALGVSLGIGAYRAAERVGLVSEKESAERGDSKGSFPEIAAYFLAWAAVSGCVYAAVRPVLPRNPLVAAAVYTLSMSALMRAATNPFLRMIDKEPLKSSPRKAAGDLWLASVLAAVDILLRRRAW